MIKSWNNSKYCSRWEIWFDEDNPPTYASLRPPPLERRTRNSLHFQQVRYIEPLLNPIINDYVFLPPMILALKIIGLIISAYLIGSIPTAVWVGKKFFNIDIREHGSNNAGATNTIRVLGFKYGFSVLLVDLLKASLAVSLASFIPFPELSDSQLINLKILLGIIAILGHVFPIFASFKGGKGVASLFGVLFALIPIVFLSLVGIFLVLFIAFRIVSLGSIICAILLPVFVFWILPSPYISIQIFSLVIAALVPITHYKNIQRLVRGEEKRLNLKAKFKSED